MSSNRRIFLKQLGFTSAGLGLISVLPGCQTAGRAPGNYHLPRSTPEAQGVSSANISAFLDAVAASKHEFHSLMIARHGHVVAEGWWAPYGPEYIHTMYSMSKSFTSTAVGFAVSEGKLSVEDKVISFFPDDLPTEISEHLVSLRIKHLLTMSVGHTKEPTGAVVKTENWVKTFLAWPIPNEPGTNFLYNSTATYMCSAIVQKVTGQRVIDYLQPRLFRPLGIEGETWETCPRGINTGGWGLSIQTEGLAKLGQLYLQKGNWLGKQIIPTKWVEEATTFKIQQPFPAKPARPNAENDWLQGYCYQFWRCQHNAYRGDGAFGQFTIVLPEHDAVIAITSESGSMQGELDLVWEHLLPAFKARALPTNALQHGHLQQKLKALALPLPYSRISKNVSGTISGKTFKLANNSLGLEFARFDFEDDRCTSTFLGGGGNYPIVSGFGSWRRGATNLPGTPPRLISGGAPKPGTLAKIAASADWKDAQTLELTWRYYETPHHDTVTCRFSNDGKELKLAFRNSIVQMRNAKDARGELTGNMLV